MSVKKDYYLLSRLEGELRIKILQDAQGKLLRARLEIPSWRGFEVLLKGRLAEEVPRLVTRICGLCPWMHHLASVAAVEACFGVKVPPQVHLWRVFSLLVAHYGDKLLHFCFLALPDFLQLKPSWKFGALKEKAPDLFERALETRQIAQQILQILGAATIHPVTALPGGFSKVISREEYSFIRNKIANLFDFAFYLWEYAQRELFSRWEEEAREDSRIETGFLGLVDQRGLFSFWPGRLRLMRPDGSFLDFLPQDYQNFLAEHLEPWLYAKMPYARVWGEGIVLDPCRPRGIYRANTLARVNVADGFSTPRAQEALEDFRHRFGRPAQATVLYHWARLMELIYVAERLKEVFDKIPYPQDLKILPIRPRAGEGVGCLEAPRGTLIHHYQTDEQGRIVKANLLVGTTHNIAPLNLEVIKWAQEQGQGPYDLDTIARRIRAYDP